MRPEHAEADLRPTGGPGVEAVVLEEAFSAVTVMLFAASHPGMPAGRIGWTGPDRQLAAQLEDEVVWCRCRLQEEADGHHSGRSRVK